MRRIAVGVVGLAIVGTALTAGAGGAAVPVPEITFGPAVHSGFAPGGQPAVVGDVTGDGTNDLVLLGFRFVIVPGNGDGTLGDAQVIQVSDAVADTNCGAAGKLNDDGTNDLVIPEAAAPRAHVYLSDGAGGFTKTVYGPPARFDSRLGAGRDISLADWDGDGDSDIVSASADGTFGHISVRLNLGHGVFAETEEQYPIPVFSANVRFGAVQSGRLFSIVAADLDGDGDMDVAGLPQNGDTIQVLLRDADGVLVAQAPIVPSGSATDKWVAGPPTVADVDGDGLNDLVVAGRGKDIGVLVYRHAAEASFARPEVYVTGRTTTLTRPPQCVVADLNGDGRPEVLAGTSLLVNAGDGRFAAPAALPGGFFALGAGNLDGDPRADVFGYARTPGVGASSMAVLPVRTGGAAPLPEVERVATGPVTIGGTSEVVILGSGFLPGITADFGPDVLVNELVRESDSKLVADVTVLRTAVPGANEAVLVNPGSDPAPFEYSVLLGGTATVTGVIPAAGRAGESFNVIVLGKGSVDGAVANLGEGVTVTSVDALPQGFRLGVTLGLDAPVGPHDLTIDNGSGVRTVAPGAFTVLPRRSIEITPTQGILTMHPRAGRGSFSVRGRIALDPATSDGAFDPATESTVVGFGLASLPSVVEIAPDGGWRLRGKRATWRSAKRSHDNVTVEIDLKKGTFRIDAKNATLLPQAATDVLVEATLGNESGASVRTWRHKRGSGSKVLVLK